MKTKYTCLMFGTAVGLVLLSGCVGVVQPDGRVVLEPVIPPPPVVTVDAAPPPGVTVDVGVPDDYVWDGYEYVGVVGGAYFYLGPGNVWIACDAGRLGRFHDWERGHPDWRGHAVRNDRFRNDARGHYQARREERR